MKDEVVKLPMRHSFSLGARYEVGFLVAKKAKKEKVATQLGVSISTPPINIEETTKASHKRLSCQKQFWQKNENSLSHDNSR